MKKRTFIKLSSALMTAPLFSPLKRLFPGEKLKNWAGNLEYSTDRLYEPASLEQVPALVKQYSKLKVLGTRHCFNTIADSKDNFISLRQLNKIVSIDKNEHTVTIEGGMNYGQLSPLLQQKGYALHNLASLPHISVAGACTTATHGSGMHNGNLSTAVRALEWIGADGSLHTLRHTDGEKFNAAVVGLGGLGVITRITLALQPTFNMQQQVYEQLPMAALKNHFDAIMSAGYSVSLFTDWQSENINEVWVKSKTGAAGAEAGSKGFFGAKAASKNMHPIANLSAENCTEQMGVPGPWYERLPHFKMGFTPSSGVELQSEYFVAHHHAVEAIQAVARLGKRIGPLLFISEIRAIAADHYWMSPCHNQASIAIHFTWKQDWPAVQQLLPVIEKELAPFKARPHWGKLFTMPAPHLASLYEKLPAFRQLLKEYDPQGKFRNDFLDKYIYTA